MPPPTIRLAQSSLVAMAIRHQIDLMGMPIDALSEHDALGVIFDRLEEGRGGVVVTSNLDFLRHYVADPGLRPYFGEADLVVADGMPLVWASRLQGTPVPERVAGSSMTWTLSERAAALGARVFLLGGNPGTAERAAAVLANTYAGLRVVGTLSPPPGFERDPGWLADIEAAVAAAAPDIVFVGLPRDKQLIVIPRLRRRFPRTWFLGVGVAFSFVAKEVRRAPVWVQRLGLEWLHRLVQEPRRLARRYLVEGLPFAVRLFGHAGHRRLRDRLGRLRGANGHDPGARR